MPRRKAVTAYKILEIPCILKMIAIFAIMDMYVDVPTTQLLTIAADRTRTRILQLALRTG